MGSNIFLVDDDADDRQLFKDALLELPFKVEIVTFENGVDLMANLLDVSVALPVAIFLDLNMPLMNGEECLADIKAEPQLSHIPIIIYSGYLERKQTMLLLKKGAARYLQKPNSFSLLKSSIADCMESLRLENGR